MLIFRKIDCASLACTRNIEKTPLCKVDVTLAGARCGTGEPAADHSVGVIPVVVPVVLARSRLLRPVASRNDTRNSVSCQEPEGNAAIPSHIGARLLRCARNDECVFDLKNFAFSTLPHAEAVGDEAVAFGQDFEVRPDDIFGNAAHADRGVKAAIGAGNHADRALRSTHGSALAGRPTPAH
jgi:hypothetical protein